MYLIYADGSGNLTEKHTSVFDFIYVIAAVSLFEKRWHGFEKTLNRLKMQLIKKHGLPINLAESEIKSNWVRIERERNRHPFLSHLSKEEIKSLINAYYTQLSYHNMNIFASVVDKRYLYSYFDRDKLHRKAWELLLEKVELFMRIEHAKHQAMMIVDDESKQANQSLALKHFYLQDEGTTSKMWLTHIVEMPMFTRSELSSGIQLADLVAYNINRVFRDGDPSYPFFVKMRPYIWSSGKIKGISVFPDSSPLVSLLDYM